MLSGCCGVQPQLREEHEFLKSLSEHGIEPVIRGVTTMLGNTLEAQFPVNVVLASLAISRGVFFDPFDESGVEKEFSDSPGTCPTEHLGALARRMPGPDRKARCAIAGR